MEEYKLKDKEEKKYLKKHKRAVRNIIIGALMSVMGFLLTGGLASVLDPIFFLNELTVFINIAIKAVLSFGGPLLAVCEAIRANVLNKKIELLSREKSGMIESLKQRYDNKEKENINLQKSLDSLKKSLANLSEQKSVNQTLNLQQDLESQALETETFAPQKAMTR